MKRNLTNQDKLNYKIKISIPMAIRSNSAIHVTQQKGIFSNINL